MSDDPKRILILTADAGFGHRSAANAVAEALRITYGDRCQISILNPMDDRRTPFFLRDSQTDYDKIVHAVPDLYKLGYDASDASLPSVLVEAALTVMLFDVLREIINKVQPDVILTTYPLYQAPLTQVFALTRKRIPLYTVVTDLASVHHLWFHRYVEGLLVPTHQVGALAQAAGIPRGRIHVTGIPVHPNIVLEKRDKNTIRSELGWQGNLPTFLLVGSRRVDRSVETLNIINHFGAPLQVVAVAGKDENLFRKLKAIDWHISAHIYDFVDRMPTFLKASDCVISKAGGLIVTESLACGLPMILIDVIPGQEEGNAAYVLDHGAGELATTSIQVLELLAHWLAKDGSLMRERSLQAERAGKPHSSFEVAEYLWLAAQRGSIQTKGRRDEAREQFINLMKEIDIFRPTRSEPRRPKPEHKSAP